MLNNWMVLAVILQCFPLLSQDVRSQEYQVQSLSDHVFHLSEVMLHDATNPPAASRVYAYALMAAHEVACMAKGRISELSDALVVRPGLRLVSPPKNIDVSFCSNYAILEVGQALMPSGYLLEDRKKDLIQACRKKHNFSERELVQQVRFAREIATQVIRYARSDHYNELSTYTRYSPKKGEGYWYPTPPAFMAAVEPQWKTVRSFFLDSASQFAPPPPARFSTAPGSSFYIQMMEVYTTSKNLSDEQLQIANFWDCNPFAVSFSGHMAIGLKKISPGGHWMGITGIACRQAGISLDSAILIHAAVAMTLHDAFISCWNEKYDSDRIRPETAINKYVDPEWRPVLQTPPFPEYSSGHSVASSSAAVVLTHFLGDNFRFVDSSEVYFGLPERTFNSFYEAADEAVISRLYGGIHFRDACENGAIQGQKVGRHALAALLNFQP